MAASDRSAVEEAALAASGRSALRLGEEKIGVIEVPLGGCGRGPPSVMVAVMAGQPAAGSSREEFVEYLRYDKTFSA